MGNKRKRLQKSTTSRAIGNRARKARYQQQSNENPPQATENVRFLIDVISLQKIINEVAAHSLTCSEPQIRVSDLNWKHVTLRCEECTYVCQVKKDEATQHHLAINEALVVGAYCGGIGYTGLQHVFSTLEVQFLNPKTFRAAEERIGILLERKKRDEFIRVAAEEKTKAFETGDIIKIGTEELPFITVVVDGGWAKRSYGHSYSSNAGVAVIIGAKTRNVLFADHRIRSCRTCETSPITQHECFRNWSGSPQSMEADIIVNGFMESYEKHGILYKFMVGDADSSVFSRVQAEIKYPGRTLIEKVDCANHAVKGLNKKIFEVKKDTRYPLNDRKLISKYFLRLGKDAKCAIMHNQSNRSSESPTSPTTLAEDLLNIPAHVYGEHSKCKPYFCKGGGELEYERFRNSDAGKEIMKAFQYLANRAHRLIYDTTSNYAELFMSIMNKLTSGKRINYAQRGSYANRVCAAVFEYNYGSFWPANVFCQDKENLGTVWGNAYVDSLRLKGRSRSSEVTSSWNKASKSQLDGSQHYGPDALQGKLSDSEILLAVSNLISLLQVSPQEQDAIQKNTVGQSYSQEWRSQRRNRITASNCGKVFRLHDWTNNSATLKSIIYPPDLSSNYHIRNGIILEPEARSVYSVLHDVTVEECGLFVDVENGIFAASPDGLVGTNGILEIKCISSSPEDLSQKKGGFLMRDKSTNKLMLKRNHNYYYQILFQLYVTNRSYCDFFVYHQPSGSDNCLTFEERIQRSAETDELWERMKSKVAKFYEFDMAPELVDPLYHKTRQFRVPAYRTQAIAEREAKLSVARGDTPLVVGDAG
jgi:hypothetical protein